MKGGNPDKILKGGEKHADNKLMKGGEKHSDKLMKGGEKHADNKLMKGGEKHSDKLMKGGEPHLDKLMKAGSMTKKQSSKSSKKTKKSKCSKPLPKGYACCMHCRKNVKILSSVIKKTKNGRNQLVGEADCGHTVYLFVKG